MTEPRLEDQLRGEIRRRQMSPRTEETYVQWYRRYILHFKKRHPREMGAEQITEFLTHLAVEKQLGRSSQNQALNAPESVRSCWHSSAEGAVHTSLGRKPQDSPVKQW